MSLCVVVVRHRIFRRHYGSLTFDFVVETVRRLSDGYPNAVDGLVLFYLPYYDYVHDCGPGDIGHLPDNVDGSTPLLPANAIARGEKWNAIY